MILALGMSKGINVARKKSSAVVSFTHLNRQMAFGVISIPNIPTQILGVVNASTCVFKHGQVQVQIANVLSLGIPFILARDFNCTLNAKDKQGEKPFCVNHDVKEFQSFVKSTGVIDLDYHGPKFTWCNNQNSLALSLRTS